MFRINFLFLTIVMMLASSPAAAAQPARKCGKNNLLGTYTDLQKIYPAVKNHKCVPKYTPGTWSFKDPSKKVKIVVTGASLAMMDYFQPGYGRWVATACRNVEVVNIAEESCRSSVIRKEFDSRVLQNKNIDLDAPGVEYWMMIQGGLNNVDNPNQVNFDFMKLFQTVHAKGMKVFGVTLVPWGEPGDPRWRGKNAAKTQALTKKCVDWMMGRLTPQEALGKLCPAGKTSFSKADLPDVALNLFDTPLLDKKSKYGFMAKEFDQDGVHPKSEGHRVFVEYACTKGLLPKSWGCDCACLAKPSPK